MYWHLPHLWVRSYHLSLSHSSSVPMTPEEVSEEHGFFALRDKTRLFYRLWDGGSRSKAVLIMIPGIGGHSYYFSPLGEDLNKHWITVIGVDSRGQGLSEGVNGDIKNREQILGDLEDTVRWVKKKFPKQKIFLGGHSLGGAEVVYYAASGGEIDGLILPGPAIKTVPRKIPTIDYLLFPWYFLTNPKKRAILAPEILASDYRLDVADEKIVQTLVYDRLIINKFSVRYLAESGELVAGLKQKAPFVLVPTLLIQGTADPSYHYGKKFFDRLETRDKEYKVLYGAKHFLFFDPKASLVFATIVDWIQQRW